MNGNLLIIALAAFLGGVFSALVGFCKAKMADPPEIFVPYKFLKSVIVALLAGIGFAMAYTFQETFTMRDILGAILGGAGAEVLTNRTNGALTPTATPIAKKPDIPATTVATTVATTAVPPVAPSK